MKYDLTHSESELDKQISAFVRRKTKEICNGYRLPIPHGYSPHLVYPFALHETQNLPWDYSFRQGFISCAKLEENKALQDIIQRIEDGVHETSPFEYHGIGSLMNLAKHKQAQIDAYQLQGSNQAQQLLRQATIIDDYKRLLSKATDSMHQPSVRTGDEAGKQPAPMQPAPMKWDTFVKFMREKGFQYDPSTAGSSVRFNPPDPCDSPITIHKPHPDPTLGPIKLVQIEKRLKRYYGWWNEEDLIRQPR
ncbi:hypothetical protein EST38_g5132 [Candolleomyces aberdarensis]|uniref:Uncharacterized protein n=1 Tax=Candolleomyces aberdarensis TaxID=2316362 RepID=A0A4V1Q436_9AGAR|nr:hypothetical protein EST38_g5132 [Candolleomyces aberdarensis]